MLIKTNYAEEDDTSFLQISLQNDIGSLAKKKEKDIRYKISTDNA